jgi:hypothetical protein
LTLVRILQDWVSLQLKQIFNLLQKQFRMGVSGYSADVWIRPHHFDRSAVRIPADIYYRMLSPSIHPTVSGNQGLFRWRHSVTKESQSDHCVVRGGEEEMRRVGEF